MRTDSNKLAFLARTSAGARVIEQLTEGDGEINVPQLQTSFSPSTMFTLLSQDPGALASFLFYLGFLALTAEPGRLKLPNMMVKRLFLEGLERIRGKELVGD